MNQEAGDRLSEPRDEVQARRGPALKRFPPATECRSGMAVIPREPWAISNLL
jgi:hypothetical protein